MLSPPLTLPRMFGSYELLERIGSGGMAEVFRARLTGAVGFEKTVVIKRLHPHLASEPGMVELFVEEAKLTAQVQHPNVVQVFDLDRTPDGELHMVMEYVEGTDLRNLLRASISRNRRPPAWVAVHVLVQVLDALAHAWDLVDARGRRRNVVHRDVAPDNVFLSRLGEVKLGDFGVARDQTRASEPYPQQLKGKFSYMAPEQFKGQPLDQRSDVFSAGVVLWEALAVRPLFRGQSMTETMSMVCSAPRVRPSSLVPGLPRELDEIVLSALEVEPDRRIRSAREMQLRLAALLPALEPRAGGEELAGFLASFLDRSRSPPPLPPPDIVTEEVVSEELIIDEASIQPQEVPADPALTTYFLVEPGRRDVVARETADLRAPPRYDIPMPGAPSSVETADLIARRRLREREKELRDRWDRLGPARVDAGAELWIRVVGASAVGPASFAALTELLLSRDLHHPPGSILRREPAEREQAHLEVSADGKRFTPAPRFSALARMDLISPHVTLPAGVALELAEAGRLSRILSRIGEKRPTGRLRFFHGPKGWVGPASRPTAPELRLTIIEVVRGRPTHVATSSPELDTPAQLAATLGLDAAALGRLVHEMLARRRPLERVLAERLGIELEVMWPSLLAARIAPLAGAESLSCVFTAERPEHHAPVAPSLPAFLGTSSTLT